MVFAAGESWADDGVYGGGFAEFGGGVGGGRGGEGGGVGCGGAGISKVEL